MNMKTLPKILMSLAIPVCLVSTASAIPVANPGFETGDLTGWTQSGNTPQTSVVDFAAHSGSFGALFSQEFSNGFIAQDLVTVAGATYDLSFWLQNNSGRATTHFEASWNGTIISTSVLDNSAVFGYTQFTFTGLLATGSSTSLQFGFRHDPAFWFFDDVSVTLNTAPPGVPETFSTLWLALPLAGMWGFARLRRRAV